VKEKVPLTVLGRVWLLPQRIRSNHNLSRMLLPLFVTGFSVAYYASFYDRFLNLTDEGFLVNGALRVLQGQVPVSDFYAYPPGRYYLLAIPFILFGATVATERMMWIVLMAVRNVLVLTVSRRLLPVAASLAVTLTVALVPGPWYQTLCSLLIFIHLEVLFRYIEAPCSRRAVLAGTVAGLTTYFRQDYPVFAIAAALVAVVACHLLTGPVAALKHTAPGLRGRVLAAGKQAGLVLASAVLSTIPLVLFYGLRGELGTVVRRLGPIGLAGVRVSYEAFEFPSLSLLQRYLSRLTEFWPFKIDLWFANAWFAYVILFTLLASCISIGYRLWSWLRGHDVDPRELSFLAVVLVWTGLTCVKVVQLPLFTYFLTVSQGVLLLLAWLLTASYRWTRQRVTVKDGNRFTAGRLARNSCQFVVMLLVVTVSVFSWLTLLVYGLQCEACGTIAARRPNAAPLRLARANLLLDPTEARGLSLVTNEIQGRTRADERIFAFRSPMIYFLTERRNATTKDWPVYPLGESVESVELAAELREQPPKIEIVTCDSWLAYVISRYSCDLQHTLFDDYDIVARHAEFVLLERSPGSDGWNLLQKEFEAQGLQLNPAHGCQF